MLIEIHPSLLCHLDNGAERREETLQAIENIATVRREGKHLLFADRRTLAHLASLGSLSSRATKTFSRVAEKLPQKKSLAGMLHTRVEVVGGGGCTFSCREEAGQYIVRVPAWWFADSAHPQRTVLLAENRTDAQCYRIFAQTYAASHGYSPPIEADLDGGGGGTTAQEYRNIQDARDRFCLCIVDSDKRAPEAALGTTAKAVKSVDDPALPLARWVCLEVRELENTIPNTLLSGWAAGDPDRMRSLNFLDQLQSSSVGELRRYLDFKSGLTFEDVARLSPDSPERNYLLPMIPTLRQLGGTLSRSCEHFIYCEAPTECQCLLVPGFGDRMLQQVVQSLSRLSPTKVHETLCNRTEPEWMRIGEIVFAWCLGAERLSAA